MIKGGHIRVCSAACSPILTSRGQTLEVAICARRTFSVVRVAIMIGEKSHRQRPHVQLARLAVDGVNANAVLRSMHEPEERSKNDSDRRDPAAATRHAYTSWQRKHAERRRRDISSQKKKKTSSPDPVRACGGVLHPSPASTCLEKNGTGGSVTPFPTLGCRQAASGHPARGTSSCR